ncbi:MAG: peptide chain release factor N(5)-glutamine methyltransferase [Pseudomonadales bacterium]|nr:peptide chain release factor N(5)-glutamine methyltransferase [Pseudomonadales bacterium]
MATVAELINEGVSKLRSLSETAALDVELLLAQACDKNRTWLKTWPDADVSASQQQLFQSLLERRVSGEPIAYISGFQSFWTLDLKVTPATLIPRQETELIVESALALVGQEHNISVLDLGTGSGAIALAIASERPEWNIQACDSSREALQVAQDNRQTLNLNVDFKYSDWFSAFEDQHFQLIVSNPPYIESEDPHLGQGDLRFEPVSALVSGVDGLDDIRRIVADSKQHLIDDGLLMIEHGYNQGEAIRRIFNDQAFNHVETLKDLSDIERVTLGYR